MKLAKEALAINVPEPDVAAILGVPEKVLRKWLKPPKPGAPDPFKDFRLSTRRAEALKVRDLIKTLTPSREKDPESGAEFNVPMDKTAAESARWKLARIRPDFFGRSSDMSKAGREASSQGMSTELRKCKKRTRCSTFPTNKQQLSQTSASN